MKILIISHCELHENSGLHVDSIAKELRKANNEVYISTPTGPIADSESKFDNPHISYLELKQFDKQFDIIHAWTSRTHVIESIKNVRHLSKSRIILHQEDNEFHITANEIRMIDNIGLSTQYLRSNSLKTTLKYRTTGHSYLEAKRYADGFTFLIDDMKSLYPTNLPTHTFYPSSQLEDVIINHVSTGRNTQDKSCFELLYPGTIHSHTLKGYQDLNIVIHELNHDGCNIRLIKTGPSTLLQTETDKWFNHVIDKGLLSQKDYLETLHQADLVVLPWGSDDFDKYRFPSKIPDLFLLKKPFLLPNTNIVQKLPLSFDFHKLYNNSQEELKAKIKYWHDITRENKSRPCFSETNIQVLINLSNKYKWENAASGLLEFYKKILNANDSTLSSYKEKSRGLHFKSNDKSLGTCTGKNSNDYIQDQSKIIAFYLPQYHPIPENDLWWGKGFTEWSGVVEAKSQFQNHRQPRLPKDLGFYDLRLVETIKEQILLAKKSRIKAFCYYYYWFNGKKLLETPLRIFRESDIDFPFCICWANEPWSRRYDGSNNEILIDQNYNESDINLLADDIAPILMDKRYLKYQNKPMLVIYNPKHIVNAHQYISALRLSLKNKYGLDIYISIVQSFDNWNPFEYGCDASIEFTPYHFDRSIVNSSIYKCNTDFEGYIEDAIACYSKHAIYRKPPGKTFRCLFPTWDNTARKKHKAHILANCNPAAYSIMLFKYIVESNNLSDGNDFVFINAWNEWGEGAILEPDNTMKQLYINLTQIASDFAYEYSVISDNAIFREFLSEVYASIKEYWPFAKGNNVQLSKLITTLSQNN